MTMRSTILSLAVVCLAGAPLAQAQAAKGKPAQKPVKAETPAKMEAPKPAPEMTQLKFFEGDWSCTGDVPAGPMGPAQKTRSTVKIHTGMNGFWQIGNVSMSSTAMSMHGMFHSTYDPGQKKYLLLWVDDMGGYAQQTSPGWEGDKMVYIGEGNMMGQKQQARDTFVKAADGSFKHTGEMQMNGQWTSMGDETCRKAAAGAVKK
jgi:Protein of unknown function (DUF1579)